jgi:hypothetical protein
MAVRDDQDLAKEIDVAISNLKDLSEEAIYYALSSEKISREKAEAVKHVLASLPLEKRDEVERDISHKFGIFGPISAILPHVDEETKEHLMYFANIHASEENGRMLVGRILEQLKDLLCDDWKYCEKRKEYKDDWRFVATAAAIAVRTLSLEVGLVTGALLVAVVKGPDFFCDCSARENKGNA